MAYSSYQQVQAILAENVVVGNVNIGTPTPGRSGSGSGRSNVSIAECLRYINFADQQIDAKLRPFYVTPLRRIKTHEAPITQDVSHGSAVIVSVEDSGAFTQWDLVRLQSKYQMEYANVIEVPSITTIKLDHVVNNYSAAEDSQISVVRFPDPISLISARLAGSFIYDRLFTQSQSPDLSTYGKTQRTLAGNAIDDILKGAILLTGQDMTGYRFVRGSLFDAFKSAADITKGEEKEV